MAHAALAAALVGLALWAAWFLCGRVTVYEVSQKARLESDAAPRDVTTLQAGRLVSAGLTVGHAVRAGEPLAELDAAGDSLMASEEEARLGAFPSKSEALRRQIAALEQALVEDRRAADAAVQAAKARVKDAVAAADFAADNARRLKAQAGAGGVAEIDALRAGAEATKAAAARDALTADVRRLGLDAETRAHQSQAQIEDLKRTLASMEGDAAASRSAASRLQLQIDRKIVRAPVDGVIAEALPLRAGAYVSEGEKLATIVPRGGLLIVADFRPATAMGRLHPGQTARLRLDGFPWAQYGVVRAKVVRVAGEVRDGALRVELAPLPDAAGRAVLRHGLTGAVEVDIEQSSPAVLLLRAAGQAAAPTASGAAR